MFLSLLSSVSTPKPHFTSHLSICSIACHQSLMATDLTDLEKEKQLSHQNLMAEHLLLIPLFPFYLFVAYSFFSFYYLNQTDRGPVVKVSGVL